MVESYRRAHVLGGDQVTRFSQLPSGVWVVVDAIHWGRGRNPIEHGEEPDIIPAGFAFESSVPWVFRWFIDPDDPRFLAPAAVHDWYLEHGFRRLFADSQWFEAALANDTPAFKRNVAFVGMFVFGRIKAFWIGLKND